MSPSPICKKKNVLNPARMDSACRAPSGSDGLAGLYSEGLSSCLLRCSVISDHLSMGVTIIYFGGDVSPRILEKYQSVPPNNRPIIL